MKTLEEIKLKSSRKYNQFIEYYLQNKADEFFPLYIYSTLLFSSTEFKNKYKEVIDSIDNLIKNSKANLGYGYTISFSYIKTRTASNQKIPDKIFFETKEDFLKFIGKQEEFLRIQEALEFTNIYLPEILNWIQENSTSLIRHLDKWKQIVKVCLFFKTEEVRGKYLRELPIELVDTKFIEKNSFLLKDLLDIVLKDSQVDKSKNDFTERYFLKKQEPSLLVRSLDESMLIQERLIIQEITPSELSCFTPIHQKVFLFENKKSALNFPSLPDSIAIYCQGFAVVTLSKLEWLKQKEIYYSGDLDPAGFEILSSLRNYYPQVKSILMDWKTYNTFQHLAVSSKIRNTNQTKNLTVEEQKLYDYLNYDSSINRIEQEKITGNKEYVMSYLEGLITSKIK